MSNSAPATIQSTYNTFGGGVNFKTNTKSRERFGDFLTGIDLTHQNLDQFTPYIRGVSRIFLHKPPLFMLKKYEEHTKCFKTCVESGYRSVSGIGNISVEFTTFEGGFNGDTFQSVQSAKDETDSVTIGVYELTGSPIREYLDTWVTGVRDPKSGIAHYHGLIEAEEMSYAEINHTAEYMYITYDPTGIYPEYSCLFAHCFPKTVHKDHLNYETGNRDNVAMDMEFTAKKYESPYINDIGVWYTMNGKVSWNYLTFNPEINGTGYMGTGGVYTYNYGINSVGPNTY